MAKLSNGFTLIEMLVSIAIVTLILSSVMFNYSQFNNELALSAGIQEISATIREAQVYGLSVKQAVPQSGDFNAAYGVYFSTTDPTHYYIFVDTNGNGKYDVGSGCGSGNTECVETDTLRDGVTITGVCDASVCPPPGATGVSITFLRPNPEAVISFTDTNGNSVGTSLTAEVRLTSPQGKMSAVTVQSTGQISAQ